MHFVQQSTNLWTTHYSAITQDSVYTKAMPDLHVFANDLHDLQVELLDGRSRQVNIVQQAVDNQQEGLLHAG